MMFEEIKDPIERAIHRADYNEQVHYNYDLDEEEDENVLEKPKKKRGWPKISLSDKNYKTVLNAINKIKEEELKEK